MLVTRRRVAAYIALTLLIVAAHFLPVFAQIAVTVSCALALIAACETLARRHQRTKKLAGQLASQVLSLAGSTTTLAVEPEPSPSVPPFAPASSD